MMDTAKAIQLVETIARFTKEGEGGHVWSSDDAYDTIHSLIDDARLLTGIEPECMPLSDDDDALVRCPKCLGPVVLIYPVQHRCRGLVTPDGIDDQGDGEWWWEDDADAECVDCGHEGKAETFSVEVQRVARKVASRSESNEGE